MKFLPILSLVAALALGGCVYYDRTVTDIITKEGYTFKVTRVSREEAVEDEEDNISYTVTFPDGTEKSTYLTDEPYRAGRMRDSLIDQWISEQQTKPGVSETIAGPPEHPGTIPDEDSKGD